MTHQISTLITAAALALVAVSNTAGAANHLDARFVDGVWINGTVHELSTGPPPAGSKHPISLYVIAPVSAPHPLHPLAFATPLGFGAHDHVAAIPNPKATYHGTCDLTLVVPGPKGKLGTNVQAHRTLTPARTTPLLYGARLGDAMEPLTWVSRIKRAQALGLAKLIDTKNVIACTIAPRAHARG